MPPPTSRTETPARTGAPSASPVTCMIPVRAWTVASYPGAAASGPVVPYEERLPNINRGNLLSSVCASSSNACKRSGRKLVRKISASLSNSCNRFLPDELLRSIDSTSLFRFTIWKYAERSPSTGDIERDGSPTGVSILSTSAPRSANTAPPKGPAIFEVASSTRTPARGSAGDEADMATP